MISRVSKDITFVGDIPKSAISKEADDRMTLRNLKVDLNEAIKEEYYEEAARLRDEIKALDVNSYLLVNRVFDNDTCDVFFKKNKRKNAEKLAYIRKML